MNEKPLIKDDNNIEMNERIVAESVSKMLIPKSKARFSLPGKMIYSLFHDNEYIQSISKIKNFESTFPKQYQWYEDDGLHIELTLAGYSPDDISIISKGFNNLIISSNGMGNSTKNESSSQINMNALHDSELEYIIQQATSQADMLSNLDELDTPYPKKVGNPTINKGLINRGAARRRFETNLFFEGDLDVRRAKATMEHGLLRIFIPSQEINEVLIKIN